MDSNARDDTDNASSALLAHQRPRLDECVNQVFVWRPCKVACLFPWNAARLLGATTLSIWQRGGQTQKAKMAAVFFLSVVTHSLPIVTWPFRGCCSLFHYLTLCLLAELQANSLLHWLMHLSCGLFDRRLSLHASQSSLTRVDRESFIV